jgi:multiple sugar transport system ATP-binding protein
MLGIAELLRRRPRQLSGGQRQRVAMGRAIVREPQAFLMDEPLSNLDAKLRVEMRAYIARLHTRLATTTVYVTHDQTEAMTMGDRVAVMRDGRLEQIDAPQELYERPANLFVARFIGNPPMNTVTGRVLDGAGTVRGVAIPGGEIPLPPALAGEIRRRGIDEVIVGVRSEHLKVGADGPIEVTVSVIEALGHERHVFCRLSDGQPVIVRQPSDEPAPAEEAPTRLTVQKVELVHLFDPATEQRIEA